MVEKELVDVTEYVQRSGSVGGLDADRRRQAARLEDGVRNHRQIEEPVVEQRPVRLQRVLTIGIPPSLVDAELFDQAPPVGNRDGFPRQGGTRRRHGGRVDLRQRVLVDRRRAAWPATGSGPVGCERPETGTAASVPGRWATFRRRLARRSRFDVGNSWDGCVGQQCSQRHGDMGPFHLREQN